MPRKNLWTNVTFSYTLPANLVTTSSFPADWGWPVQNLSALLNYTVVRARRRER